MYYCNFCSFHNKSLKIYLEHRIYHRNIAKFYHCGYEHCKKFFQNIAYLKTHLHRSHGLASRKPDYAYCTSAADENGKFKCTIQVCQKKFDTFNNLIKHLKGHIMNKEKIICPFKKCLKAYTVISSFTSHLCKYHKNRKPTKELCLANDENLYNGIESDRSDRFCTTSNNSVDASFANILEQSEDEEFSRDLNSNFNLFLTNIAHIYLKLESQLLIPSTSIQYIVSEMNSVHNQGQDIIRQKLKENLMAENISTANIERIIENSFDSDPFIKCYEKLNTDYKRKKYFKEQLHYVEPQFIEIDDEKKTTFVYIPIIDTLRNFFNDRSLKDAINLSSQSQYCDILNDFKDGKVFRENQFFKKNTKALQVILYQDAFEIVNPIGSAKTKYKILAIYMTVGNIPDNFRSHINCIKLVALCKEKDFDHWKVYGKVVEDLKILQETGIDIDQTFIKGSLIYIVGDNLGSHGLGGFTENFSKVQYFCRFCLVTRDEFYAENGACKMYEPRTIETYNTSLQMIENTDFKGIKFNSIFNELQHYHVCLPGLPPCLGHDLLEGIVAYDMLLYIKYFIKNKWFTLNQLNSNIENFNYSTEDRKDKTCTINLTNKKIPGGACQIWNFLRLFPLLIENKIKDIDNEVWKLVLLLDEIVEIISAPSVHISCLPYLQTLIFSYLSDRQRLFSEMHLRPKHHYLAHYPQLILQFGPLIKVWTMRFESKHRFFKRAVRYSLNFKNVLKSLSVKHELLQSFIRSGADIRIDTEVHDISNFQKNVYNVDIQKAIQKAKLPLSMQQCKRVVVKGTEYKPGYVLIIDQDGYRENIKTGKICLLLLLGEDIYILFEIIENEFKPHLNAYELGRTKSYEVRPVSGISDFKPLHVYDTGSMLCIKPYHAFVSHCV